MKQGDILGRIDAEPYRIAVHQAEANAEIARAAIAAAEQQANAARRSSTCAWPVTDRRRLTRPRPRWRHRFLCWRTPGRTLTA